MFFSKNTWEIKTVEQNILRAVFSAYGLIIVVICVILLMLAFSQGALFTKIKAGLTDSVSRLVEMANKAVTKAETNGNSALEGTN